MGINIDGARGGHTPGPWKAIGAAVYAEPETGPQWEIIYHAHNTRSAPQAEREANARLIASAPELAAALRVIAAQDPSGDTQTMQALYVCRNAARAALKKAGL